MVALPPYFGRRIKPPSVCEASNGTIYGSLNFGWITFQQLLMQGLRH